MILRLAAVLLVLVPLCAIAQPETEVVKERQRQVETLIENVLADIPNLRLAENRAITYVKAGNLAWRRDPERARSLFQSGVAELINAQTAAEAERKNPHSQSDLLTGQSTRPFILGIVASRDAELALEFLYKSRPSAVAKAIAGNAVKSTKIGMGQNYLHLVQNELNTEQRFIVLAAQQKPERAEKFIKDAIAKGLSGETFNLLQRLNETQPEMASKLASEVISKLSGGKWLIETQPDYQSINLATTLVNEFNRSKGNNETHLRLDEIQIRTIARKLIAFHVEQTQRTGYSPISHAVMPIAEKLFPTEVDKLRKLPQANARHGLVSLHGDSDYSELTKPDVPIERMLSEAKKFPAASRRSIYNTAANRMVQEGNFGAAADLLREHFDDDALEQEMRNLTSQHAYSLIHGRRYDEAESLIMEMPEEMRLGLLINLANTLYSQQPNENAARASSILQKARVSLPDKVETANEVSGLVQLANAFSTIDPPEAFRNLESIMPYLNEIARANLVINGFHGNQHVKHGEMLILHGNTFGIHLDQALIQRLSQNDFERTLNLINSFEQRETRIGLALQLAEGIAN